MPKVHRLWFTDDFKSQAVLLTDSLGRAVVARTLGMSRRGSRVSWVYLTRVPSESLLVLKRSARV